MYYDYRKNNEISIVHQVIILVHVKYFISFQALPFFAAHSKKRSIKQKIKQNEKNNSISVYCDSSITNI